MGAIERAFERTRRERRPALMPYLCAGYPDPKTFRELLRAAADAGADLVEIGVPFSDPIADGPVIQQAAHQALLAGTTPERAFEWSRTLEGPAKVVMTYVNPVLAAGPDRFFAAAAAAGFSGAIIPDLPPEAARRHLGDLRGLALVPMVAPTTTPGRLRTVLAGRGGFVYLVSVAGVTGARRDLPAGLAAFAARVGRATDRPVCVGFGIATAAHVRAVGAFADGVIVGSALIRVIAAAGPKKAAAAAGRYLGTLRRACDAARR